MIWVIGGTSDALKIVDILETKNKSILVTTTTDYGSELAQKNKVTVLQKMLDGNDMLEILKDYSIQVVIDASHPFAECVSTNAIEACRLSKVKYVRYERDSIHFPDALYYESYAQIIASLAADDGNILFTIGSKNLKLFSSLDANRMIARVLPVAESINLCREAGFQPHQIIATKGRLSSETNKSLMLEYGIKHLVTKDSGDAGGLKEKIDAAKELGLKVHILKRPAIDYPQAYTSYTELTQHID